MTQPRLPNDTRTKHINPQSRPLSNEYLGNEKLDHATASDTEVTHPTKKRKSSQKKSKKRAAKQAYSRVLEKAKSFKTRPSNTQPQDGENPSPHSHQSTINQALPLSSNWKNANWELLRKNLYSPDLYVQSLRNFQVFHIDHVKKDLNFLKDSWQIYWRWINPVRAKKSLEKPRSDQSVNKFFLLDYPSNYPRVQSTPFETIANALFFGPLFTKQCADSFQQLSQYQAQAAALNTEYLHQWKQWQIHTQENFFSFGHAFMFGSGDVSAGQGQTAKENQWPHSQNYLFYGHAITTH